EENIRHAIKGTLDGAVNFSDIDNNIRNGDNASKRIFPQLQTPAFEQAYHEFKSAFQIYIQAMELSKLFEKEKSTVNNWKVPLQTICSPLVLFEPLDAAKNTLFHKICLEGSDDLVKIAIAKITELEDIPSITPFNDKEPRHLQLRMMAAAKEGDVNTLAYCLSLGAHINATISGNKKTVLEEAAQQGHVETVEFLLTKGAAVTRTEGGWHSPLHRVAMSQHIQQKILDALVNYGANLNEIDVNHNTALHYVASSGNLEATKYLMENGADSDLTDDNGDTALHRAAAKNHRQVCEYLVKQGANLLAINKQGENPSKIASKTGHNDLAKWFESQIKATSKSHQPHNQARLDLNRKVIVTQREQIRELQEEITRLQAVITKQNHELQKFHRQSIIINSEDECLNIIKREINKQSLRLQIKPDDSDGLKFTVQVLSQSQRMKLFGPSKVNQLDVIHDNIQRLIPDFKLSVLPGDYLLWQVNNENGGSLLKSLMSQIPNVEILSADKQLSVGLTKQ
ncbi:MAG: ankyrin repeat domain-containing protein, partial [Gammaproteobacteria bacterium]